MKKFLALSLSDVVFIMLINVKMPTMAMINFVLSWVEYGKSFINSGPGLGIIISFYAQINWPWKFIMLINVKMPTIVGILTFMSMINTTSVWKFQSKKSLVFRIFVLWAVEISCSVEMSMKTVYNLWARGEFNNASVRERSFWYLSLFVTSKSWHQYSERPRVLASLNSPKVSRSTR